MSQSREPLPDGTTAPAVPGSPVLSSGLPLAQQFMAAFQKTVRSANIYSRNNQLLSKFQSDTFALYDALARERGDLELGVRADRLLLGRDVVLTDTDRENGIPFRLYREGVRRLTLVQGMPADELLALVAIFGARNTAEEDLVTRLWQAALPHVKYVTVDISSAAYTPAAAGAPVESDDDADQGIREELNGLLAAIYQGGTQRDDGIRGISVGADDLLALKALGTAREQEMDAIGRSTQKDLFPVAPETLQQAANEAESETDATLMDRAMDVLLAVLFSVRSGAETRKVIEQLLGLYDSLLLTRDFRGAAGLVDRVRMQGASIEESPSDAEQLKALTITRALVKQFISEQRMSSVIGALNEMQNVAPADMARLVATLGQDDTTVLLGMLPGVQNPQQRRLICDTIVGLGIPRVAAMAPYLNNQEWFVGRDVLYLLSRLNDPDAQALILGACDHPHPRLRQAAISMLGPLPHGEADERILAALTDADPQIRQAAVRLAGARKLTRAVDTMESIVTHPDFGDRDLGEIKSYLMAFAVLGGERAVETLDRILNPPILNKGMALLDRLRTSVESAADSQKVDLRIAAAAALGAVDHPSATAALQRGARSMIPPVKQASIRALGQGAEPASGHPDKAGRS